MIVIVIMPLIVPLLLMIVTLLLMTLLLIVILLMALLLIVTVIGDLKRSFFITGKRQKSPATAQMDSEFARTIWAPFVIDGDTRPGRTCGVALAGEPPPSRFINLRTTGFDPKLTASQLSPGEGMKLSVE